MRRIFSLFAVLAASIASARGMGTIDRTPVVYGHPYRYEGYTGLKGPAGRSLNQRQKRKLVRQMA